MIEAAEQIPAGGLAPRIVESRAAQHRDQCAAVDDQTQLEGKAAFGCRRADQDGEADHSGGEPDGVHPPIYDAFTPAERA
jgi:hypothetical protein